MKSTSSTKKLKASVASLLCVLLLAMPVLSACNDASSAPDDTTASTESSDPNGTPSKSDDNSNPTEAVPVETVTLSQSTLFLVIGEASDLTATVEPSDAGDKSITWSTSDASVATVADGTVTAVGAGTATVTATGSNGKSASCEVTVADNEYTEYDNVLYLRDKQRQNPYAVLVRAKDKSITSCNIHEQAEIISDYAFLGCSELTNITIPNSVTSIGEDAFRWCSKLKYNEYDNAIYLGNEQNPYVVLIKAADNSITSCNVHGQTKIIAGSAFFDCSALTSFDIPNSVTSIGAFAFEDCYALTSITIPDSVVTIEDSAFDDCKSLEEIVIVPSVTTIGDWAFHGCDKLKRLKLSKNIARIGLYAFGSCESLEEIQVEEDNQSYKSIDGNLYTKDGTVLLQYAIGKNNTEFVLPDSVRTIAFRAISDAFFLEYIDLNNAVFIEKKAMCYATGLKKVKYKSEASFGDQAFDHTSEHLIREVL